MGGQYFRFSLMREISALNEYKDRIHGLAIEAHILELFPSAISTFMSQYQKPYFIDPKFYDFAFPFFDGNSEKRWADPLIERYCIKQLMESHPSGFDITHLMTSSHFNNIIECALDYQRTRLPQLSTTANALSMLSGGKELPPIQPPEFLVAPYVVSADPISLSTNIAISEKAINLRKKGEKIFLGIALSRELFTNPKQLDIVLSKYARINPDGFLIWAIDFRENGEDSTVLEQFEKLCHTLRRNGKIEVINLFGGFYSTILCARRFLSGVTQGVGISEHRDPYIVASGWRKKYYLDIPHQMIDTEQASDLSEFSREIFFGCTCKNCSEIKIPVDMKVLQLACHFLESRIREFELASNAGSIQEIIDRLKKEAELLRTTNANAIVNKGKDAKKDDTAVEEIDQIKKSLGSKAVKFSERLDIWVNRLMELKEKDWIK